MILKNCLKNNFPKNILQHLVRSVQKRILHHENPLQMRPTTVFQTLFFAVLASPIFCQNQFSPAKSSTPKEVQILEKMDERLDADLDKLPKAHRTELKKMYTGRTADLKKKLSDGHFLFDKNWNDWLDGIAEEVYRANPHLPRRDIRLFWGRYAEANACSFGEGSLVFNVGLLPFFENEAQVAFILCHELAHFSENHSNEAIQKYIQTLYSEETQRKLKDIKKSEYGRTQKALDLLKTFSYGSTRHGRFRENEADSLAIVFLSKTNFDASVAVRALEILDETDSIAWAKIEYEKLFDSPQFSFKSSWLGQKQSSLAAAATANASKKEDDDWNSDSLKTHPDCRKRMARAAAQLERMAYQSDGKNKFVQPDSTFSKLKNWAPLEALEGLYFFEKHGRCLFRTLHLLHTSPDDAYLNAMVARNLYHLHRHQQAHTLNRVLELPDPHYSAEYDRFLKFMNQFRLRDLAQMNYFFCENRLAKFSENEDFWFAATLSSLANDLPKEFSERRREYFRKFPRGKYTSYLKEIVVEK